MLEFLKNFDPLLLDVIFVALLVLIALVGFLRGIKKVSINMFIFVGSFLLAFSSLTNSVKSVIATKFLNLVEFLPAGSSNIQILIVMLFTTFLSALIFGVLIYLVFHVLKTLLGVVLKSKLKDKDGDGKSLLGRFVAAVLSLLYQGSIVVILLMVMNTNIIGMNSVVENSTVSKKVVELTEKADQKLNGDVVDEIVIRLFSGDVFAVVDDNLIVSYRNIENESQILNDKNQYIDILNEDALSDEEVREFIKQRIVNLRSLAVISTQLDTFEVAKDSLLGVSEEWLTTMNRVFKNRRLEKVEFTLNEYSEIRLSLVKIGLNGGFINLYEEIAVGK